MRKNHQMEATDAAPRSWETVTVKHPSSFASLTSDSSAEPTNRPCPNLQQNDSSQSSDLSEPEAALGADSDAVAQNPRDEFERRQESAEGGSSRPAFGNHGWGSWGPWGGNTNFNPGQTNFQSAVVTSSATTTIFQTVAESQAPPTSSTLTTNADSADSRGSNLKLILPLSIIIPLIAIALLVFFLLRYRSRKRVQTGSNRRSVHPSITPYNKILLEQSYVDGVSGGDGGGGGRGEGNHMPSRRTSGLGRQLEREITSAMRQLESLRDLTTQYHRRSSELSQIQVSPVLHPHSRQASFSTPPPSYLPERDSIV